MNDRHRGGDHGNPARPGRCGAWRPGRRWRYVGARLAAQIGILTMLGGVPYALYALAGNPLPDLPALSRFGELLTSRDDGSLFLTAVTWAGWIGWASFALPLLVEIPCQLARRRPPQLLGLVWQQRRAAALVAVALSISATPAVASASAVTISPAPASAAAPYTSGQRFEAGVVTGFADAPADAAAARSAAARQRGPVYEIARGDWLYHIADRFLGDGDRYPDIAALNPELERADPRFPDHIEAGQQLRLPAQARDRGPRRHATGTLHTPAPAPALARPGSTERSPATPAPTATQPPATAPPTSPTPAPTSPAQEAPSGPAQQAPGGPAQQAPGGPAQEGPPAQAPADGHDRPDRESDDGGIDLALPVTATFATAGLLTALLLLLLAHRRRRQRRYRRPGRRIPQSPRPTIERQARAAAQSVDVSRLDHALRVLAAGLRTRDAADLPDIAAVWLSAGEVHLMLTQANPVPPPPLRCDETAMTWTLPAAQPLSEADEALAPLPVLATIASKPGGNHLLIDLERTGLLGIGGDPDRTGDLIRYLAAELATNQWSDDAEVFLAGFDTTDAADLIAIGGDRVKAVTSTAEGIGRARRRAAANAAAMADSGITSTFAGRVADIAADAWMPHVLLIADLQDAEQALRVLETELRLAGRCGVAVAVVTELPTPWRVEVNIDGALAIDWLSITNTTAARLPREQLAGLAPVMRAARTAAGQPLDEAVPAAQEPDPWAENTDAHGHLLEPADLAAADNAQHGDQQANPVPAGPGPTGTTAAQGRGQAVPEPVRPASPPTEPITATQPVDIDGLDPVSLASIPPVPGSRTPISPGPTSQGSGSLKPAGTPAPASTRHHAAPPDPDLDTDLDAWHRPDPDRPRIAILGPVHVEAPGEPPDERARFYAELVVYLAQRGHTGATGEQIDDALWPERGVNARSRRVAISKVRRWLGENTDGALWLPPNIGSDRRYRLTPGILLDWQLFRRLRACGEATGGDAGAADLRRALDLVRGEPLAGAELPYASGYRNPYAWLPGSDVQPHNLACAVVDTAHQLCQLCLAAGDTAGARWAVERAWLADPARLDDHPWIDAMRVARADGRAAELRALLDDLVASREAEVPEDLPPDTYAAIHELLGDLLRVS